jgi:hypothetical protein
MNMDLAKEGTKGKIKREIRRNFLTSMAGNFARVKKAEIRD